jgi:hypothetical protein
MRFNKTQRSLLPGPPLTSMRQYCIQRASALEILMITETAVCSIIIKYNRPEVKDICQLFIRFIF